MKKNKNEVKGKPKYPLFKSLCQMFLLAVLFLVFNYAISMLIEQDFIIIFFLLGIVGSVFIFINNFTGNNYIKMWISKVFSIIVKYPKKCGIVAAMVVIISIAAISFNAYNKDLKKNDLCGTAGNIYYCESGEAVSCSDGEISILDGKGYKCISENDYKHDILHLEYDYICLEKYGSSIELYEEEKQCLRTKLDEMYVALVEDLNKDLPKNYDIRDRVNITAGDQGKSYTCSIWARTKALEISAQLKGIDYQFLLDFEKKINSLNVDLDKTDPDSVFGNVSLVPGNWQVIDDVVDSKDYYANVPYWNLNTEKIDKYRSNYSAYFQVDDPEAMNRFFGKYYEDIRMAQVKHLVMDYGNAFIVSPEVFKHAMVIIGWDDAKGAWLVLNSWGNTWTGYDFKSNGDGTTWIKYSDSRFELGDNIGMYAAELISQ